MRDLYLLVIVVVFLVGFGVFVSIQDTCCEEDIVVSTEQREGGEQQAELAHVPPWKEAVYVKQEKGAHSVPVPPSKPATHPTTGYEMSAVAVFLAAEKGAFSGVTKMPTVEELYAGRRAYLLQMFPDADSWRPHAETELEALKVKLEREEIHYDAINMPLLWAAHDPFMAALWVLTGPEAVKALEDAQR